ncbi:HEPN domain-containing protein [Exiguobacterium sp. s39]|uniref:HEPN domain-containing protein n=1 Tax=Exiguobacterium sp. s39 TaxID=2751198 RepID=UPI001BE6052F|nr:HEPN domain-containing protein [Exiguobacterium sp. s39]
MTNEISEFTIEYLLIVDSANNFCSNIDLFNSLITSYADITFNEENDKIFYNGLTILYKVHLLPLNEQKDNTKNVFNIYFTCENVEEIEKFKKFISKVVGLLRKVSESGGPYLLRDDINAYYSRNAYAKVHEIENLMRKLINKFMVLNVGTEWTKNYIPSGSPKENDTTKYLQSLNINQLSDILFVEYSPNKTEELLIKIKNANEIKDISLNDLKKYVKQSNWDRIFKDKVEFSGEFIKSKWEDICKIRNIIAHNKPLSIDNYNNLLVSTEKVKEKLNEAIFNLDKIKIPEEEKVTISKHLVPDEVDNLYHFELERQLELVSLSDLMERLTVIEWRIIKLIDQDLKERFDSLNDNEKNIEASSLSSKMRIDYLQKNKELIPYKVLKDIQLLFNILPKFKEQAKRLPNKEYEALFYRLDKISERVKKYLIARTFDLD